MNEKGFTTLSLIMVMPFLLTLFFGFAMISYLVIQKNTVDNICYQYILSSQKTLVEGNNKLMHLNPLARSLQIKKKILNQVRLFSIPPVAALAESARQGVIASQHVLKFTQESIKTASNIKSRAEAFKLKMEMKKKLGELKFFWKKSFFVQSSVYVYWNPTQIQIDENDIAPTYKRGPNHWRTQGSSVRWSFNLHQILPDWLTRKDIVKTQKRVYGQCASHPHNGGRRWTPAIGEGRH